MQHHNNQPHLVSGLHPGTAPQFLYSQPGQPHIIPAQQQPQQQQYYVMPQPQYQQQSMMMVVSPGMQPLPVPPPPQQQQQQPVYLMQVSPGGPFLQPMGTPPQQVTLAAQPPPVYAPRGGGYYIPMPQQLPSSLIMAEGYGGGQDLSHHRTAGHTNPAPNGVIDRHTKDLAAGRSVCRHYLNGRCNRRKCRFLHVTAEGAQRLVVLEPATVETNSASSAGDSRDGKRGPVSNGLIATPAPAPPPTPAPAPAVHRARQSLEACKVGAPLSHELPVVAVTIIIPAEVSSDIAPTTASGDTINDDDVSENVQET